MTERTYRIGEAARILDLEGYVLRYWETEFSQLHPTRTEKGQRLYSEADLSLLRRIRYLLHEQGMTIDGARKVLEGDAVPKTEPTSQTSSTAVLRQVASELESLQRLLSGSSPSD